MDFYKIVSLILSIFGAVGIASIPTFFIKQRLEKKAQQTKHVEDLLNKEQEEDLKSMIKEGVLPQISAINKKIDKVCEGTKCSLRNDILNNFYQCCEKGYRNQEDTENFNDLYEAYTLLDGNSFIADTIYPEFMEIDFRH